MKTLSLLLLWWMAGYAMGQTIYIPGCQGFDCPPAPPKLLSKWEPRIDAQSQQVTLVDDGNGTDWMPRVTAPCHIGADDKLSCPDPNPPKPEAIKGRMILGGKPNDPTHKITLVDEPEAEDVPAIQEDSISHHKGDSCFDKVGSATMGCAYGEDVHGKRPGCADKTRILFHDEQTPPKYWCHRVQP